MNGKAKFFLILPFILLFSCPSYTNYKFLGDVISYSRDENQIYFDCGGPEVQLTVLAPDLIRVRLAPEGEFAEDNSYAVIRREWPPVDFNIIEREDYISLFTSKLEIRVDKFPFRLSFYDHQGNLLNRDYKGMSMGWDGKRVKSWKELHPDEKFYGLGEKVGGINKRGKRWVMWNTDAYGYNSLTDPLYQSHPFFIGLVEGIAYGIFLDNTYKTEFEFATGSDIFYSFGAEAGELDYYFFYGPEIKNVLNRFTDLVGRMPLPPLWALGYQQCRYSYYPESEVLRIAQTFREKQIPADVIYLDIHYMDEYRVFTWDRERFPDPERLLSKLEKLGFKVVVIIDPGIKVDPGYRVHDNGLKGDHFVRLPDGSLYIGQVWPGDCYFPDFSNPRTREWWGSLYKDLIDSGVDGIWNDMNEPAVWGGTFPDAVQHYDFGKISNHLKIHNVYALEMVRGTYEGLMKLSPNTRPFVLTRAGFSGIQRYAAVWTGDNQSNWEHLYLSIPMTLGLGLSGVSFAGYDVGGFAGSPSPELFTRWLQLGVFTPLLRNHTAFGTRDQEPWSFGDGYEAINKKYIKLRYELLPYIYDAFEEASSTGIPVMRPMVLEYQKDEQTYSLSDQFLFGEDILVAPVYTKGASLRKLYLPEGVWFDYWSNKPYEGPGYITMDASLERLPLLVKGGAIIPMQEPVNYTGEKSADPLIIKIYPASISVDSLYEDRGEGFEYKAGAFSYTPFRLEGSDNEIKFRVGRRMGKFKPTRRNYLLKFEAITEKPTSVKINDEILKYSKTTAALEKASNGWTFIESLLSAWVKFPDKNMDTEIVLEFKSLD